MREVFLAQTLESMSQYSLYVLYLQVLVSDFHHLKETSYKTLVGLGHQLAHVSYVSFLRYIFCDIFLHLLIENKRQLGYELQMSIFQSINCTCSLRR